nr:PREDICTED: uncharacterized protein LOC109034649 [Bemisia tabaci]
MAHDPELESALCRVRFLADERWQTSECARKNQELLRAFHAAGPPRFRRASGGARTVRRVIPNSRLARYGDYPYDEAREFIYTVADRDVRGRAKDPEIPSALDGEPWMLPEVGYYFSLYTRFAARRLNQLKQYSNRVKRVANNSGCGTSMNSQDCAIYMSPPLYSKNYFLSTQLTNRYYHLPRFVSTVDQSVSHIRDFSASASFCQQNLEYYDEFKLRGLIQAKSVQQLWLGDNQHYLVSTLRTTTATDSFAQGCRFAYQSRKCSYQSTKRCPKQWYKNRPFLDVNVSGFQSNIQPRIFNIDNALIPHQICPLLAVTNCTARSSMYQTPPPFQNQMRSLLPPIPTPTIVNPLAINVYNNSLTPQSLRIPHPISSLHDNDYSNSLMNSAGGPEKVAAALTKVKTWLKKVYPKRGRDMKKPKRMMSHPFALQLRTHLDNTDSPSQKSKQEAERGLPVDVEKCFADLEKEAIEQYQSSADDLLKKPITPSEETFMELERQALEQYQMKETRENSRISNGAKTVKSDCDSPVNLETAPLGKAAQSRASTHRDSYKVALLRKTNTAVQSKDERDHALGKLNSKSNIPVKGKIKVTPVKTNIKER